MLLADGKPVYEESGEVQFTDTGISGICVFGLSVYAGEFFALGTIRNKKYTSLAVQLDLLSDMAYQDVLDYLLEMTKLYPARAAGDLLSGLLNMRLGYMLVGAAGIAQSEPAVKIKAPQLKELASLLKGWRLDITGTKDFLRRRSRRAACRLRSSTRTRWHLKKPGALPCGRDAEYSRRLRRLQSAFCVGKRHHSRKKRSLSLPEGGKTMIRISDISMPLHYTDEALRRAAAKKLRTDAQKLKKLALVKRSVDARKKQDVRFVVTVDAETDGNEDKLLSRVRDSHVTKAPKRTYAIPPHGTLSQRPDCCGFWPGGHVRSLLLARAGLCPIILERGGSVEERQVAVNTFWQMRKLNPSCNVQFGEGGAGTFSDGKLNTGTKDERIFFVLQTLCEHGAPEDILFDAKPHVARTNCRKPSVPFARRSNLSAAKCASTRR